jgi:hypothetical protein
MFSAKKSLIVNILFGIPSLLIFLWSSLQLAFALGFMGNIDYSNTILVLLVGHKDVLAVGIFPCLALWTSLQLHDVYIQKHAKLRNILRLGLLVFVGACLVVTFNISYILLSEAYENKQQGEAVTYLFVQTVFFTILYVIPAIWAVRLFFQKLWKSTER